ncbi:hypothetical protein [Devosia sp.]|uniref:hypothetical protein n=1 Tax=Devosia sp. TaxID=1871048 RepID=UPI00262842A0|nr:hypothetical protein [Devosia sp.]
MQIAPNPATSFLRPFGLRARLIIIASGSACWLLVLLALYFAIFYGPKYTSWLLLGAVISLVMLGGPKLSFLFSRLRGIDAAPYPEVLGHRSELFKFSLSAIFIAYCVSAFLIPGPPEVRVAIGAALALVPVSAEILLPTPQKAHPLIYKLLILAAATPIALVAAWLSEAGG